MNMRKMGLVSVALVFAAVTVFATGEAEPAADEPQTLRIAYWGNAGTKAGMLTVGEAWAEQKPLVTLDWVDVSGGGPGGSDKMMAMIAGGDAPDILHLNTGNFEAFAARGVLMPLDDRVAEADVDMSVFWDLAVEGSRWDGTLYAMPSYLSNHVLYYNKDHFDDAGLAYPDETWTWDDVREAAIALTRDTTGDGRVDKWGFAVGDAVWAWSGVVYSWDGKIMNADSTRFIMHESDEAREALRMYFGLLTEHEVSPHPGSLPDQAGSIPQFINGTVAMGLFGAWFRPALTGNEEMRWDVTMPPASPIGRRSSSTYVNMWSIYHESAVADTAWDAIEYFSSPVGTELLVAEAGGLSIPAVEAAARTDEWKSYAGTNGQVFLDALDEPGSALPPHAHSEGRSINKSLVDAFADVMTGNSTVDEAIDRAAEEVNQILSDM